MSVREIRPAKWCLYEYKACPHGCPLDAAEARLREAHRRWHEAADAYQAPDDFRDAVNSCVQALRNVTFMLQAAKAAIPGFNDWYPREQEAMAADRILRWVVKARNRVVKQGDLEAHSLLNISTIFGYLDEAAVAAHDKGTWSDLLQSDAADLTNAIVSAPVNVSVAEARAKLDQLDMPVTQREATTVLFERRWVVDDMPSDELLTMLAHAYGSLRGLIGRCHKVLGYELARVAIPTGADTSGDPPPPAPEWLDELPLGGRLPCMVSTHAIRRTRYRLTDGKEVQFLSDAIEPDIELMDRLRDEKPYGELVPIPKELVGDLQKVSELESLVAWYAKMAKGILRSGQDHGWFTYYFRKGRVVGTKLHMAIDAQGKTAIAGDIARRVEELDADAVVLMSEVWVSPNQSTLDGGHVPPSLYPDRGEALMIHGIARSGAEANLTIPFEVVGGEPPNRKVIIEEPIPGGVRDLGLLRPTLITWGVVSPRPRGHALFRRGNPQRHTPTGQGLPAPKRSDAPTVE